MSNLFFPFLGMVEFCKGHHKSMIVHRIPLNPRQSPHKQMLLPHTVIRVSWFIIKFGIIMSVNGTLVDTTYNVHNSPLILRILSSTSVPFTLMTVQVPNYFALVGTKRITGRQTLLPPSNLQSAGAHTKTTKLIVFVTFFRRRRHCMFFKFSLWARRTGPRAPEQRCARWRCQYRRIWQRSGWWQLPRTSAPDPGKREFQFIACWFRYESRLGTYSFSSHDIIKY